MMLNLVLFLPHLLFFHEYLVKREKNSRKDNKGEKRGRKEQKGAERSRKEHKGA